jgi:hypothetical protein
MSVFWGIPPAQFLVRSRSDGGSIGRWGGPGAGPAREPQGRKDTLRQREASEFTSEASRTGDGGFTHKICSSSQTPINS